MPILDLPDGIPEAKVPSLVTECEDPGSYLVVSPRGQRRDTACLVGSPRPAHGLVHKLSICLWC